MANNNALIKPFYSTAAANQPVALGHDTFCISCEGNRFTCPGKASLQLRPRLRLTLDADFSSQPEMVLRLGTAHGPITLQYGNDARPVNVLMVNSTLDSGPNGTMAKGTFIPNPERLTVCTNRHKWLAAVTFHVMNFPAFLSQGDGATDLMYKTNTGGRQCLGRVFLEHAGWRIELQTMPEAGKLIEQLRTEGGFAVTHVGRLTRINGSNFRISQADAMLRDLHHFLSFARGLWVPLELPVGVDTKGNRIYEAWGGYLATAWEARVSWFDDQNGQALAALFPGFMDLLHDADLSEAAKVALYWYLRSNRAGEGAGVDSGIILSQAALDRLTNAYLTKMGLSTKGNATQRFRRAFRQLNLPTEIPRRMSIISTAQRNGAWTDLPEVVVKVRNELIHPKALLPFQVGKCAATVWQIAQWYIELSILALTGYRGVYSNRLCPRWSGQVEQVPWAQ